MALMAQPRRRLAAWPGALCARSGAQPRTQLRPARGARMMLAMHGLQAAQRQVRVDLRGGNVGVAQHHLHAAQVGAVLHHVRGATVAQPCGLVEWFGHLDQPPNPLARERHAAQGEKQARAVLPARSAAWPPFARGTDAREMRPSFAQILLQSLKRGAAQRDNALLVALAAHLHAAQHRAQDRWWRATDFGDAQPAGIQQLQNGAVAQRGGLGLRMRRGHAGALQHLRHLRLGQRLGQHLPRLGRLDVDGGIVMNAAVEQQPLVKAAQAAQLARRGARVDAVVAQMLEKRSHIRPAAVSSTALRLSRNSAKVLRSLSIGLAGERAKPFFHAQIGLIVLQKREDCVRLSTLSIIGAPERRFRAVTVTVPGSLRNQHHHPTLRISPVKIRCMQCL